MVVILLLRFGECICPSQDLCVRREDIALAALFCNCKSTHAGKETLTACIPAQTHAAKNQLYEFVEKSHGSHTKDLVRSIAGPALMEVSELAAKDL